MLVFTRDSSSDTTMACACVGPDPGKTLCPCAIRRAREQFRRGDCLICGAIGGHDGIQCHELDVTSLAAKKENKP